MLLVNNLVKRYAGTNPAAPPAVDSISFEVEQGQFFTLLGPSGCGKTTTLQCIAGLEDPTSGEISLGGEFLFSSARGTVKAANQRNIGMIFQSYAIWPHMTVFDNVAFPLVSGQHKRPPRDQVRRQVLDALEMVKLSHLADRPSPFLSGGQQQRVALARALVHRPSLLLLDEPLSNLDAKLRDSMRVELRALVKAMGITAILVTHDQAEALSMSDKIVLMSDGKIVQQGTPREVFLTPRTRFTADFMGRSNLIPAKVLGRENSHTVVETPAGTLRCHAPVDPATGSDNYLSIPPNALLLSKPERRADANVMTGTATDVIFMGDQVELCVRVREADLRAAISAHDTVAIGETVELQADPQRCILVDK